MRRFVCLAVCFFFILPIGLSVTGCGHGSTAPQYCSSGDSGPQIGQVATITINQSLATLGESLSYGQIGQSLSATAQDCKGNSVSTSAFIYASSDLSIADINPSTGQVCAGKWNRFTGGGVPDYTFCTAPATPPSNFLAYVTASANGAVSNSVPVYVHPIVTSVELAVPSSNCAVDNTSNCCPANASTSTAPAYDLVSCISQNTSARLAARVYAGGTSTSKGTNITCQVGHLSFAPQTSGSVVTIDQSTGVATANQPGSTTISATISTSGSASTAGFFSTCPPASIVLSATGKPGSNINVALNNLQPFSAEVVDTKGKIITGLSLEFNSTTPRNLPAGGGSITPLFPGSGTITAVCQPGICNPSPFSEIGLNGNGQPITSNGITINTTGTSSSVIYAGSTSSQYLYPVDFTTAATPSLVKLPYVPNSMVISQDGATIYLGSSFGLMTVSTANNSVSGANISLPGTVLSVAPDSSTVVLTDPARQTVSLVNAGAVYATYGAVGTAAQWSPDSQTVYITTASGNQLLVHSAFLGWKSVPTTQNYTDVTVTVPHIGAYFAGSAFTEGRSYCASTVLASSGTPPIATNTFYPVADDSLAQNDRITATNDGAHILGATATAPATLNDMLFTPPTQTVTTSTGTTAKTIAACPMPTQPQVAPGYFVTTFTKHPLTGVTATAINSVIPSSNSTVAFVTYNGASGLLPLYVPATGVLNFVPLSGGAGSAPVSGVFSTDNLTFYTGTSGDNKIHLITVNGTTATDSSTLTPNLPDVNGNIVAPNLLVQRPKRTTS